MTVIMSHFVSTGANFDDLNAQLLRRRNESEEHEEEEEGSNSNEHNGVDKGLDDEGANDGTIRARPNASYDTSRHSYAGSSSKRPLLGHAASTSSTPYMSRKNSEEDLIAAARTPRRTSDRHRFSAHLQSNSPDTSRPTSPAPKPRRSIHAPKGVAFSEDVNENSSSSASSSKERMQRSNSGIEHHIPRRRHHQHHHHNHNASAKPDYQQDVHSPLHILSQEHQDRLAASGLMTEKAAPRKLGTWDGVFMPVSLNVSDTSAML